ncbi:peptide chain release factor N(5)-glutamine methyltransferase [Caloramator sp. E03]|uniref:peptide chain release factor N(5)-glutamine methyltransferase n=1 Tax=Caloramator sp. E03 TaxID=2576307 RepID=UPI001110B019|nr:peptide chain release factor N(5)-glutamine methyltransferase [Caloramator sp. E03]QCX33391.1 peptide chain release factor N(5)-glutamine methyltransferase [Caloramator sp. E03]
MKVYEALNLAKRMLDNSSTPQLDAEVLLSNLLEKDRVYLYINRDKELSEDVLNKFLSKIERRKKGEPVSYITGYKEFMSLNFKVKEGVLIPRPDTEILVEKVLENVKDIKSPIIVDVGCGSGAISVSIARYKKDAIVYALDIMDIPLEVTKENSKLNGVEEKVIVLKSDILKGLSKELYGKVDVIVSNPPYIRGEVIPNLMEDVKNYEPYEALYGGEDGLYFYKNITKESMPFLKDNGFIAYEIGHDQGYDVQNILKNSGFYKTLCFKDLAGHDRAVLGWRM